MSNELFGARRKALEESFFTKQEAELREKMRKEAAKKSQFEALKSASGIDDEDVLHELVRLEISADDLAAVSLVPIIEVAWADGTVVKEHKAIMQAAQDIGIEPGSSAAGLLDAWLSHRPDRALFDNWKLYTAAIASEMTDVGKQHLAEQLIGHARAVAQSAGGFLGLSKISKEEQAILDELTQALS